MFQLPEEDALLLGSFRFSSANTRWCPSEVCGKKCVCLTTNYLVKDRYYCLKCKKRWTREQVSSKYAEEAEPDDSLDDL